MSDLQSYGAHVKSHEDSKDACIRWVQQEKESEYGPQYICADCHTPFDSTEVP